MGIVKDLAEKYNLTIRDVRSGIMKAAVGAYRMILNDLGLKKGNKYVYRKVLKYALPAAWTIAREQQKIPTPEEVYKAVVATWPTYKSELMALLKTA